MSSQTIAKDGSLTNGTEGLPTKHLPTRQWKGDADGLFPQELPGWDGYVEWEKYPERKRKAAEILRANKNSFEGVCNSPRFRAPERS